MSQVAAPAPGGTVFLRTTRDRGGSGPVLDGLDHAVGNTGNYFYEHALLRHIGDAHVVHAMEDVPDTVDRLVLSMANFVSGTTDLGYIVDCLERKTIHQVVMVGAGAQAYDYGEEITLSAGTRRFLGYVADRSVSIGVRGHYTAEVLNDLGIRNVTVIGCPAVFWSGPAAPVVRQETLPHLPSLAVNATPVGHYRDKISTLFAFGMRHEADYVAQAERWMAALAASPETTPYQPLREDDAVTYFAYPACTPTVLANWLRARTRWFFSPQDWIGRMGGYDLSVGSRFHGNLAAIQAGTPALNLVFDTRTRELCEYLSLPTLSLSDFHGDLPLGALHALADYRPFTATYARRYETYRAFLTESGLAHPLRRASGPAAEPVAPGLPDRVRARLARQIADDVTLGGLAGPQTWQGLERLARPGRSRQERADVERGRLPAG